jgi:tRNA modification GTPase
MLTEDTIVAVSTPPGRGGIGIVRLSGPQSRTIAEPILHLRQPLAHAAARFATIVDGETKLDEAVVTFFTAPNSYTAQDVVEIAAHGSPVVLEFLVRHAVASGARLARPGEFTERAFLSGRIDLTQAEAVRDLIEAQTIVQARLAAEQMGGALSRRIGPAKEQLVSLIATLEAGVDFAEDDIDILPNAEIVTRIDAIQQALAPIAASYAAGRLIHDGLTLAIVGPPNAGKSSLFNRLVERERAIVTPVAGTTRDLVTERISIAGIPVELTDTAGLRTTMNEAELIGIAKTREAMASADVILAILDATKLIVADTVPYNLVIPTEAQTGPPTRGLCALGWERSGGTCIFPDPDDESWQTILKDTRTILVANKIDLLTPAALDSLMTAALASPDGVPTNSMNLAQVSALTGAGIVELRAQILQAVNAGSPGPESGMLTTVRHHEAITQTQSALNAAQQAVTQQIPHEMLLLDLYTALQAIDSLTGTTTADDILNRIFSTFCIGK